MPDPTDSAIERGADLYVQGLGLNERESILVRGGYLAGATYACSILQRAASDDAVVPSDDRPVRDAPGLNGPSGSPTHQLSDAEREQILSLCGHAPLGVVAGIWLAAREFYSAAYPQRDEGEHNDRS